MWVRQLQQFCIVMYNSGLNSGITILLHEAGLQPPSTAKCTMHFISNLPQSMTGFLAATVIVDDQHRHPREAHNQPDGLRRPRDDGVVVAVRDEIGFM
jgi:hypothetical protein